jgi:hypothetical protein
MRQQLLDYITANLTGTIKPSSELPFEEGNQALYLKNLRRVYLAEPYQEQTTLYATLGGSHINERADIVQGYLTVDAKNRNTDLDAALTTLGSAKDVATITGRHRREFDYTTSIDNDRLTYEFQYRFYSIV